MSSGRPHGAQRDGELSRLPAQSKTPSMSGNSMRENRESQPSPSTRESRDAAGRPGRTPRMHEAGSPDSPIVPTKSANKGAQASAESMEGRDGAKGNTIQQTTSRTQSRTGVPHALERVRQAARRDRKAKFTALLHHVTVERMRHAYKELKAPSGPGVDGVTWTHYQENLEGNLPRNCRVGAQGHLPGTTFPTGLHPKADGTQRPLGIASLEDKIIVSERWPRC